MRKARSGVAVRCFTVLVAACGTLAAQACAQGGDVGAAPLDPGQGGGGGYEGGANEAGASVADAGALPALPPVDTTPAERIGVYDWGADDSQFAAAGGGATDRLTWSAAKVKALGAHTIRVALSSHDPYKVNPAGAFNLATAAAAPAYDALFADPQLHTIIVTAYSAADETSPWQNGYSAADAASETEEVKALAQRLLVKYPGKTFVIANWEGDNAIAPFAKSAAAWTGYQDWINARADGVAAARAETPASTSRVYSALEFNALRGADNKTACGSAGQRCVVTDVAPNVRADLYAYSSWQSLSADLDETKIGARLAGDLDQALAFVQKGRPTITKDRFFVGELGAPRDEVSANFGECKTAARMVAAISSATTWGARWAIDWQIIDNAPTATGPEVLGFGLIKASGANSLSYAMLSQMYAGTANPSVPAATWCPDINVGGIINGAPGTAIKVGSTVSLYGHFAATQMDTPKGYVVHVRIADKQTDVTVGTPYWFESYQQLNATLAGSGMAPAKGALVWVTSPAGVDSNGQYIDIAP